MSLLLQAPSDSRAQNSRNRGSALYADASTSGACPTPTPEYPYAYPYGHARERVWGSGAHTRSCIKMRAVDNHDQAHDHSGRARPIRAEYSRTRINIRSVATFVSSNFRERALCEVRGPSLLQRSSSRSTLERRAA